MDLFSILVPLSKMYQNMKEETREFDDKFMHARTHLHLVIFEKAALFLGMYKAPFHIMTLIL
jgi:hypothetical protein